MKRIICIFMFIIMVVCTCINTSAETATEGELFKDIYLERYYREEHERYTYKEVYYHYDINGEMDWCLVNGKCGGNWDARYCFLKFDDFVLVSTNPFRPFWMGYGVYDVKEDRFLDLVDNYDELSNYEGLYDVLKALDRSRLIGDGDKDGVISVIDANVIQSVIAGKMHFSPDHYTDKRGIKGEFLDYDQDGVVSVIDATAIQMKLAKKD